jgi:hypothetical protein
VAVGTPSGGDADEHDLASKARVVDGPAVIVGERELEQRVRLGDLGVRHRVVRLGEALGAYHVGTLSDFDVQNDGALRLYEFGSSVQTRAFEAREAVTTSSPRGARYSPEASRLPR